MKKLLLGACVALSMAACSESSTAPTSQRLAPTRSASGDFECRSGYVIAFDEFGNPYCIPDPNAGAAGRFRP